MSHSRLYKDQAAAQRSAAMASDLQNVRDRCERAAQAWDALAARSERADAARAQADTEPLPQGDTGQDKDRRPFASSGNGN